MKNTRLFFLFAFLGILSIQSNCKKGQTKQSIYYECKVDGIKYIADGCVNCLVAQYHSDSVIAIRANSGYSTVVIAIAAKQLQIGEYTLDYTLKGNAYYDYTPYPNDEFRTDSIHTGLIKIIEYNTNSKIIAGTFSFQGYSSFFNKTVNVTEGKFRLNYYR